MADNTLQSGNDTMASDDIGGVKYARAKVVFGVDGSSVDASATNPLPVIANPRDGKYYDEAGVGYTIVTAWINLASGATTALVGAAGVGKTIRVLWGFILTGNAATTVTLKSGASAISPDYQNDAYSGANIAPTTGCFVTETAANAALNATASASGVTTAVQVAYVVRG